MDDITAPRKLTATETSRLRSLLHSKLTLRPGDDQSKEDAADLLDYAFAMIANGKDVKYVVAELKSMEMEVCNSGSAEMLGRTLGKFLFDLKNGNGGGRDNDVTTERRGNGGNNNHGESVTTNSISNNDTREVGGRGGSGGDRKNFQRQSSSSGRGPGRGASLHNAAFQRLNHNSSRIPPQDQHRNRGGQPPPYDDNDHRLRDNNNGNIRGGRGDNWGGGWGGPSGRGHNGGGSGGGGRGDNIQGGGRGGGRDIVMVGFNNNQRGDQQQQFSGGGRDPQYGAGRGGGRMARGGGPFQNNKVLGIRRTREEVMERGHDDFVAALDKGLSSGRGDVEQQQQQQPKKHRWVNGGDDDVYAEQHQLQNWGGGNDETMAESYQGGGSYQGRGGRSSGRGRGRGGGRFTSTTYYPNNNDQEGGDIADAPDYSPTEEAAFVSESPLIAASFGRGRGRGFYRGGGRVGRGRGRGGGEAGAGRAEVAEKLSAMVWKRPRTMDEGLSTAR